MAYEDEKAYLSLMPGSNSLSGLDDSELDPLLFSATETLKDFYHERHVTPRIVVIQAMYDKDNESSQYAGLREQGITSYSTKRGSVSFSETANGGNVLIAPKVYKILGAPPANVGRLI